MTVQSEYQLENELIGQLKQLGYAYSDASRMKANYCLTSKPRLNVPMDLRHCQKQNGNRSSVLNTGTVFERAKNLRDIFPVKFDDGSKQTHLFPVGWSKQEHLSGDQSNHHWPPRL